MGEEKKKKNLVKEITKGVSTVKKVEKGVKIGLKALDVVAPGTLAVVGKTMENTQNKFDEKIGNKIERQIDNIQDKIDEVIGDKIESKIDEIDEKFLTPHAKRELGFDGKEGLIENIESICGEFAREMADFEIDFLGRLDGIARLATGLLILTDWKSGSLLLWDEHSGHRALVSGLRGPADFCLVPRERGLTVVVPDLVTGDLYIIGLAR